jgi:hypothetical protein
VTARVTFFKLAHGRSPDYTCGPTEHDLTMRRSSLSRSYFMDTTCGASA